MYSLSIYKFVPSKDNYFRVINRNLKRVMLKKKSRHSNSFSVQCHVTQFSWTKIVFSKGKRSPQWLMRDNPTNWKAVHESGRMLWCEIEWR